MTLPRFALLLPCALLACERAPTPPHAPEAEPSGASFDNSSAVQSIVRPEVIAETEPTPEPTPSRTPVPLPTITVPFPSGRRLDDAGRAELDKLLADPAFPAEARLVLRGHSDAMGDDARNLATSRHRAEAVRDYLIEKGVAADNIEVIALGERRPVAPNATLSGADDPAGRARNRRVDVEVRSAAPPLAATPDPSAGPSRAEGAAKQR